MLFERVDVNPWFIDHVCLLWGMSHKSDWLLLKWDAPIQQGWGGYESWVNITLHVSLWAVDFCHPRLPTNLRRANWTSLIWKLLWSFQLKPTLTWQFISHCDIDFNNHFVSQVDEAYRGQGLGGLLIEAAEDVSKRSLDATLFGVLTLQNAGKQRDTLLHFDCLPALAWGLGWNCATTTLTVLEVNVT